MRHDKKRIERQHLEEAIRASSILPPSIPVDHERPDFLLPTPTGVVGVELTELGREDERANGVRLGFVAPRAQAEYMRRPGAVPVSVSPVFSPEGETMDVRGLVSGLVDFVYDHRNRLGSFDWYEREEDKLPRGYLHIGVFRPAVSEGTGKWRYFRAGDTTLAEKAMLDARIAAKERAIGGFSGASRHWLLIVNDLFLGPGEVSVREQDLAEWSFQSSFDKLLLFERQPGGTGRIFDLRRT
jgi:hypothetical protein